jgi:flagellar biosynthesis regulator FlbT
MATIRCKYHPLAAARWYCDSCQVNLCPQCTKRLGPPENIQACHSCGEELSSLGLGNAIPPFWGRIPRFFLYPIKPDALMYLGMLSLLSLVVFIPLLGFLIYLVISYAVLKYGYLILNHTAGGNLSPPEVLGDNLAETNNLPLKQTVVFVLMIVVVVAASLAAPALGIATLLLMMFSMPASIMSMAINQSIGQALNPMALGGIIRRIGWPYLILYLFLLLLSGGSALAQDMLVAVLPLWLLIVLGTFVSSYFTVIMFNMMGYVVYQYHEVLGLEKVREFDADVGPAATTPEQTDPFETELRILINEGKVEQAKERLRERLRSLHSTVADRERYHKLLQLSRDCEESSRHGLEFIQVLITLERTSDAVQVYADCVDLDSKFKLSDGGQTYALAELANGMGKSTLALRMLNKFAQRFPRHPNTPQAYFLAAKLLCEHKGADGQAKKVLDGLLAKYPEHEIAGEIRNYRDLVAKLNSGGGPVPSAGSG